MGWISATDMLHARSLFVVGTYHTFRRSSGLPDVPPASADDGMAAEILKLRRWSRWAFLAGANRLTSAVTFWRRGLWERAGRVPGR